MLLGDREASMGKRIADQPVRIEEDLPIMFVVAVRAHGPAPDPEKFMDGWLTGNYPETRQGPGMPLGGKSLERIAAFSIK